VNFIMSAKVNSLLKTLLLKDVNGT
jgi:hypothetical protein